MTIVQLTIPDELEAALQVLAGDVEVFILDAVRQQLRPRIIAADDDIEAAASADTGEDFLTPAEVSYYLNLPDVQTR